MRFPILILFLLTLAQIGCGSKIVREEGSGTRGTETRELEEFDSIDISGLAKVIIKRGNSNSCEIRTDDNLLEFCETKIEGNTLYLSSAKAVQSKIGLNVFLNSTGFSKLNVVGATKVILEKFNGNELEITAEGAIDLSGDGSVSDLKLQLDGQGSVSLGKLKSQSATVVANGAMSIDVYAENTLDAKAHGAAKVTVAGKPSVTRETSGASSIREQ